MSNGLQSLLGRSLTQSLGLGDILSKRESETQRLGELRELQGQAELERARGAGQASLVSEMGEQRRQTIREVDMPRDKMSLLLSLGGAAVGGIGLGMGLSGAKLGAQIGSSLSGSRAPGQMVVGGLGAVQGLGAAAAAQEMAGLEKRKLIAETGKLQAETLKTAKEAMGSLSNKELAAAELSLQMKGYTRATKEDLDSIPTEGFVTIGKGKDAITMLKPVTGMQDFAVKAAILSNAKKGAESLLSQLDKDEGFSKTLMGAATPGAQILKQHQAARSDLDLITEGLGRALSGAAVPASEIRAFKALFAILTTDTPAQQRKKLNRSVQIIKDTLNLAKYGGTMDEEKRAAFLKRHFSEEEEKSYEGHLKSAQAEGDQTSQLSPFITGSGFSEKPVDPGRYKWDPGSNALISTGGP